jgi:hypothetical protein
MKSGYEVHSAITFLLVGLGVGSALAILFNPKQKSRAREVAGVNSWRTAGLHPEEKAEERIA